MKYTDENSYFISESSVYRLLKAQDLITSPAYILMEAADKFQHPTTRVNEMWQTDFTYFKIIGWGWYYLSTVLDDYSRFIIAWRLCTGMSARMYPILWMMHWPLQALKRLRYSISRACLAITARVISPSSYLST